MKMAGSIRMFSPILLLLLIATASEMGPAVVEGRTCESASKMFKGVCVRGSNCASVCLSEGFPDGKCSGLRRRCFCTRPC